MRLKTHISILQKKALLKQPHIRICPVKKNMALSNADPKKFGGYSWNLNTCHVSSLDYCVEVFLLFLYHFHFSIAWLPKKAMEVKEKKNIWEDHDLTI